jgi:hypothetical protein
VVVEVVLVVEVEVEVEVVDGSLWAASPMRLDEIFVTLFASSLSFESLASVDLLYDDDDDASWSVWCEILLSPTFGVVAMGGL